jgi:hypothetical protein
MYDGSLYSANKGSTVYVLMSQRLKAAFIGYVQNFVTSDAYSYYCCHCFGNVVHLPYSKRSIGFLSDDHVYVGGRCLHWARTF